MITELSQRESQKLLGEQSIGRLACVLESGEPYVVPVNYLYRNEDIFIHSLPGLKVEALRANPKACVQVDDIENVFKWQIVVAFGEFEEITNVQERQALLHEFIAHFQKLTPVETISQEITSADEIVVFRIRIKRLSGISES